MRAKRCELSENKKLYKLFDCLSGTALEFANRCVSMDSYDTLVRELIQPLDLKKVQVGKDQEKAQSEKDSHSKNRRGKKPN